MQSALKLTIDFKAGAGYLIYRPLPEGSFVTRTQTVNDDVLVDFDGDSQVLGIELLSFDDQTLSVARRFAEENELSFPELLTRKALVPIDNG
jgi:uncharacterized protein YuzE